MHLSKNLKVNNHCFYNHREGKFGIDKYVLKQKAMMKIDIEKVQKGRKMQIYLYKYRTDGIFPI